MNQTSFKHLSFVSKLTNNRLRLVKPNGYPIYRYDVLEYERVLCPEKAVETVKENITPSFLSSHFKRTHSRSGDHTLRGLCVVATMTCLYLLNDDRFVPHTSVDEDGINHWWFVDTKSDFRYDLTSSQYDTSQLNQLYQSGKPTTYYGWGQRPATRFLNLIQKIQPYSKRYKKEV